MYPSASRNDVFFPKGSQPTRRALPPEGIEQTGQDPQGRCLAGGVGTDQAVDLARGHAQGETVNRDARIEVAAQAVRFDAHVDVAHCQLPSIATSTGMPERRRMSAFGMRTSTA